MSFFKSILKRNSKSIKALLRYIARSLPTQKYCCICDAKFGMFIPHPKWLSQPRLMAILDVVGSDLKQHYCPMCYSHDRERHLVLYMRRGGVINKLHGKKILHFAAEKHLTPIIVAEHPATYIKCDLYPSAPDIEKVDMQKIPYEAQTFDYVIANHVLEHVFDDEIALFELHRVLKSGGLAILQTPYSAKLKKTIYDPGFDDVLRTELCGQADHVRIYGLDIFNKIESIGFRSIGVTHAQLLPDIDPIVYGVNIREPFFLFTRV